MSSVRNPRDGVNVKCVSLNCVATRRRTACPSITAVRRGACTPTPQATRGRTVGRDDEKQQSNFYLRTPAPSDDHAVLWYLPTCPEMRGLRTPPQTLLTLPRRSFFSPISPIPLTPPARPRSRASLAQSFFTCVWTTATLKERTCARAPFTIHLSMSQCPFGMMVRPPVSPPQNSMRSLSF